MAQVEQLLAAMESRLMAALNEKHASIEAKIQNFDSKVTALLTRLEKTEKALEEVTEYMKDLSARIDYRDQMDLIDCFRITGLPAIDTPREDQLVIIVNVFKKVGVTVTREDLSYWNMYNNRQRTSATISGKFCNPKKREEAFSLFKIKTKNKPILFGEMCKPTNDEDKLRVIRLRSNLTKATMNLINLARQHMTIFAYVWEKNGRIFVRKNEDERAFQIKSESELKAVIKKYETGNLTAQ